VNCDFLSIKKFASIFVHFACGCNGLETLSRHDIFLGRLLPFSLAVSPLLRSLVWGILRVFAILPRSVFDSVWGLVLAPTCSYNLNSFQMVFASWAGFV
jgi:hypothetical protein